MVNCSFEKDKMKNDRCVGLPSKNFDDQQDITRGKEWLIFPFRRLWEWEPKQLS